MKCHDVYWEISIGYAVFKAAVSRRFSKPVYHFQVWSGGIVVLLAGVFSAVAPVAAQTALTYSFSPQVIPEKYTQPIRLEVAVLQRPTRGMIDFSPAATTPMNIDLHDDGLAGDRTANDGVYTVLLPVEPILRALRSDDVQRVFVGHLNLFNDAAHVSPINLFVDIYSPQVGTYAVSRLSNKVQVTSHLVNIWDESFFSTFDAAQVTREFYRLFGDDYDFLNIVSMPSRVANRDHLQVRNDVQGIGAGHIDRTGTYGSKGRLLGITRFPAGCLFDGATVGYVHELGHQWINYLNLPLLRSASPHWPFSSMAGGIMGFSIGGRGGEGGNFPCQVVE